jgi:hypothetical protein
MYTQEEENFVASRVFPIVPVQKASDRYVVYSRADFNRNTMRKRAPSTESAGGGYNLDNTPTYSVDVWALHKDIDDQIRANADAVLNLDLEATRWLTSQFLISKEIDWATNFFAPSLWTTNITGVAAAPAAGQVLQWNQASSTPIKDIRTAKQTVQLADGGFRPNKLVLGRPVFDVLCDHPDFVDRIKYGQTAPQPAQVTRSTMAQIFELDEVLVMDGIVNTGIEGAAPDSGGALNANELNAFIGGGGGKAALLVYTPSAPGLMTPGAGFTFAWTGYFGATVAGTRIGNFYIPQVKSMRMEMEAAYAHKLAGKEMAAFFNTIVA